VCGRNTLRSFDAGGLAFAERETPGPAAQPAPQLLGLPGPGPSTPGLRLTAQPAPANSAFRASVPPARASAAPPPARPSTAPPPSRPAPSVPPPSMAVPPTRPSGVPAAPAPNATPASPASAPAQPPSTPPERNKG
jgi:hypothetical protein